MNLLANLTPRGMGSRILPTGFDPDAQAFFAAAGITDPTQKSAVNALVLALKPTIWSKMIGLYPYVGGTSVSESFNLVNPAAFQIAWIGTGTFDANGWQNDTFGGLFGSVTITSAQLTANSLAFGFYNRTDANSDGDDFSDSSTALFRSIFFSDNNWYSDNAFNGGAGRLVAPMGPPTRLGLFTNSRTASNAEVAYRNSTALQSGAGAQGDISALTSFSFGTAATNHSYALHFFSTGLTSGDMTAFYTAVQAFQTTLGRQV